MTKNKEGASNPMAEEETWISKKTRFTKISLENLPSYDFASSVRFLRQLCNEQRDQRGEKTVEPSQYERAFGSIRFRSTLHFSHPSRALARVDLQTVGASAFFQPVLWVNFIGLAGIQGPLALAYSERILRNYRQKDAAAATFLDIFNHRFVQLFYNTQQWIPGYAVLPPHQSPLGGLIQSLGGIPPQTELDSDERRFVLTFKTLFWKKVRSKAGLQQILSFFLGVKVSIHEWEGGFGSFPVDEISKIGSTKGQALTLGRDVFLGQRTWFPHRGISIYIETPTHEIFESFNPHTQGRSYRRLLRLVQAYLPQHLEVRLFLGLSADYSAGLRLGSPERLGFNAWLGKKASSTPIALRVPRNRHEATYRAS